MTSLTSGEGNTSTSPPMVTYRPIRSKRWCMTLNNYSLIEHDELIQKLNLKEAKYIIAKEMGEFETPHLQGYFEFKNARSFASLKKMNQRLHLEKAIGNKKQNIQYCKKEHNYITNFPIPRRERIALKYKNTIWKDWQQKIINIIDNKPDDRTIHWVYDKLGNSGKSFLCKYLACTRNIIIASGKKTDIFNQIKNYIDIHEEEDPTIIIIDCPRRNLEYINYGAIEEIKNGLIYSGKYEGGQCIFECPHVIVFANELPELDAYTSDRWNIIKI